MRCDRGMNDELAALKALKADFSARTQNTAMRVGRQPQPTPESQLAAVQAEVAALRAELGMAVAPAAAEQWAAREEQHIPHLPAGTTVASREAPAHEIKTQEVADGVFLHTYQNTDGPPLLVTYRVETKTEELVSITMSFAGSENIVITPRPSDNPLAVTQLLPAYADKTLICSVRQVHDNSSLL